MLPGCLLGLLPSAHPRAVFGFLCARMHMQGQSDGLLSGYRPITCNGASHLLPLGGLLVRSLILKTLAANVLVVLAAANRTVACMRMQGAESWHVTHHTMHLHVPGCFVLPCWLQQPILL